MYTFQVFVSSCLRRHTSFDRNRLALLLDGRLAAEFTEPDDIAWLDRRDVRLLVDVDGYACLPIAALDRLDGFDANGPSAQRERAKRDTAGNCEPQHLWICNIKD